MTRLPDAGDVAEIPGLRDNRRSRVQRGGDAVAGGTIAVVAIAGHFFRRELSMMSR